jgi:hypothetical protein
MNQPRARRTPSGYSRYIVIVPIDRIVSAIARCDI